MCNRMNNSLMQRVLKRLKSILKDIMILICLYHLLHLEKY